MPIAAGLLRPSSAWAGLFLDTVNRVGFYLRSVMKRRDAYGVIAGSFVTPLNRPDTIELGTPRLCGPPACKSRVCLPEPRLFEFKCPIFWLGAIQHQRYEVAQTLLWVLDTTSCFPLDNPYVRTHALPLERPGANDMGCERLA